jgi:hypothetical protein
MANARIDSLPSIKRSQQRAKLTLAALKMLSSLRMKVQPLSAMSSKPSITALQVSIGLRSRSGRGDAGGRDIQGSTFVREGQAKGSPEAVILVKIEFY